MDDLISRQKAIDALAAMYCKSDEEGYVWIIRRDAWARIDSLPPAEPKRGKWAEGNHANYWKCSECGEITTQSIMGKPRHNFCPNCGAKMEDNEDE